MSNLRDRSIATLSAAPAQAAEVAPGDRVAGRAAEEALGRSMMNPVKVVEAGAALGALLSGDVDGAVDSVVDLAVADLMLPVDVIDCVEEEIVPRSRRTV